MTWVAAGVTTAGLVGSATQYFRNKKQAEEDAANRPQYQIPEEAFQNLTMAEQQAMEGLPEEQKSQYLSNVQRSANMALADIGTRKGGLAGLGRLNENLNKSYSDLLSADAAARQQNQQQVYQQRSNIADYRGQQFQLNELNPYYENIARRQANRGALAQNLMNSAQLGASILGTGAGGAENAAAAAPAAMGMTQQGATPMPAQLYQTPIASYNMEAPVTPAPVFGQQAPIQTYNPSYLKPF
jgi:hypothetical protein